MIHTTIASIPEDEDAAATSLETHEEEAGNWGLKSTTSTYGKRPRSLFRRHAAPRSSSSEQTAGERVAAGNFGIALAFLLEIIAIRKVEPLRDLFTRTNVAIFGFGELFPVQLSVSSRSGLLPALPNTLELFKALVTDMFSSFLGADI
jgi:hypothetical protein